MDELMSDIAERDVEILELQGTIDAIKDIVNRFSPGVNAAELLAEIKSMIDPENEDDGIDEQFEDDDEDFDRGEDIADQDGMTSDFW